MTKIQKREIKKAAFYIRRGLIRWAVMLGSTLAALCGLVYMLEDPDGRLMFYLFAGFMVALLIGNAFYGKEEKE